MLAVLVPIRQLAKRFRFWCFYRRCERHRQLTGKSYRVVSYLPGSGVQGYDKQTQVASYLAGKGYRRVRYSSGPNDHHYVIEY
jgi:hypothetical protein